MIGGLVRAEVFCLFVVVAVEIKRGRVLGTGFWNFADFDNLESGAYSLSSILLVEKGALLEHCWV